MIRFNTLFQLLAAREAGELQRASTMLMMPDLFAFLLTGVRGATQLFDPVSREWCRDLIEAFGFDPGLFQPIIEPGERTASLIRKVRTEHGLSSNTQFAWTASHDTAAAFTAKVASDDVMFISSGTWSLVGIEMDAPLITEQARKANFTNEAGVEGPTRFLRNACGL